MAKKDNQKKSKLTAWVLGFILVCLIVYLLSIAMPFVLIGGIFGIWYFIKKKPDIKKRNISLVVAVVGLVGTIFLTSNTLNAKKTSVPSVPSVSSVSYSSSKKKQKTEDTSASAVESSILKEAASSSSTESSSEESAPNITKDNMPAIIERVQQRLSEDGFDMTGYNLTYDDTILYLAVPDETKYYDKTKLQQFADGFQNKVHSYFNGWALENNYNYNRPPLLVIKTQSGDRIASETLSGNMKLKK
ncbi:TM2 domain-containing protein [Streptococcus lutetiensis]|uniref:TM2 domain-containing protein n=1 Tax=Streptococcus lutetiensis TaxID=150055 RepID=UPI001965F2A4|nr:TM2 domain-containing protein [Streptococcus lutetiensis]